MASNNHTRPFDDLSGAVGASVLVRLKGAGALRGTLRAFDVHLNLVLEDAEELDSAEGGQARARHARLLVRGDNVLFISL